MKNVNLQSFKSFFRYSFWICDLECHGQTSLKLRFSCLALFSWNLENYKIFHRESKSHSLYDRAEIVFKVLFWIFDWRYQNGIRKRFRVIFIPIIFAWGFFSLFLKNNVSQIIRKIFDWSIKQKSSQKNFTLGKTDFIKVYKTNLWWNNQKQ